MTDSKVVSFCQSADFLRSRALKQKRGGNYLDALDLLRRGMENGGELCMELADVYADMQCHTDSRAMAILHMLYCGADADACYNLGKYCMEVGALPEAEKAYRMFLHVAEQDGRADEVREDMNDIHTAFRMWKQIDRHTRRKVRRMKEVRRLQSEQDFAGADSIYEKELQAVPHDSQMRVNRAMNYCLQGNAPGALHELDLASEDLYEYPATLALMAARVYLRLKQEERARQVIAQLDRQAMNAREWLMLMSLQQDMGETEAAYASGCESMKLQPYDPTTLHMLAVCAYRLGKTESVIAGYWQRILRIDPEDDVAHYYLSKLRSGELNEGVLSDACVLPGVERLLRGQRLLEMLNMSEEQMAQLWDDHDDRRVLHWALLSDIPALVEPAIRVLSAIDTPGSMRYLAEFVARTHMDEQVRMSAVQALMESRSVQLPGLMAFMQMQMIPGYQDALNELPVAHRQTVRMAQQVLEMDYDLKVDTALAVQCISYLQSCEGGFDRMLDLRCAAAAFALNELRAAGRSISKREIARKFGCSERKLKYYLGELSKAATGKS